MIINSKNYTMKKVILSILVIAITWTLSFGQYVFNDSIRNITITGYAGVLTSPKISVITKKPSATVTVRLGGSVEWRPKQWLSLYGLGAGEIDETGSVEPFAVIAVKLKPHKKVLISLGKIASPMTELRPLPTTGSGQFETWTQAQIPGSGFGGKLTYSPTSKISLVTGGIWRGSYATIEAGISVPYTKVAGYYQLDNHSFGAALTFGYKIFTTALMYNHRKNAGAMQTLEIPKAKGFSLYSDIGFNTNDGSMLRGEWGCYIPVKVKFINGLFGLGYDHMTKTVNSYVFIYL